MVNLENCSCAQSVYEHRVSQLQVNCCLLWQSLVQVHLFQVVGSGRSSCTSFDSVKAEWHLAPICLVCFIQTLIQKFLLFCRSEELYNFLISLRQQCCYLTETIQDVISRFPRQTSQVHAIWLTWPVSSSCKVPQSDLNIRCCSYVARALTI